MATIGGPNTEKNNLVFGYDTGYGISHNTTGTRHYKGKPTENLLALAGDDTNLERSGQPPTYHYKGTDITSYVQARWTSGNNVLVQSFEGKRDYVGGGTGGGNDGYPRMYVYFSDWTWSSSFGISTYDWSYNSQLFTMPNPAGKTVYMGIYHMNSQNPGKSYSRNQSISFNTIDVPYTNGSRSSTQSLIDLTKIKDIDVSNVSFSSTGQPDFDGTNEYINLGNYTALKLGFNFSLEFVVKPEQDKWMYFFHKGYGANNALAWGRHSSSDNWFFSTMTGGSYQNSYMGTATLSKYCHLVATYDGANLRLYENGILKVTSAMTHQMMDTNITAGIGGPDRYWNGEIPVTKVYSKVLSTQEVQQNFNAYKNRFGI
jgi:hypothetical protein